MDIILASGLCFFRKQKKKQTKTELALEMRFHFGKNIDFAKDLVEGGLS